MQGPKYIYTELRNLGIRNLIVQSLPSQKNDIFWWSCWQCWWGAWCLTVGAVARQVSNLPPVYVRGNLIHSDHLEHSTMMMMSVMKMIMLLMVMMRVVIMMTNPHLQNHKYAQRGNNISIPFDFFFCKLQWWLLSRRYFAIFSKLFLKTRQNKIYKHVWLVQDLCYSWVGF